jgi:Fcf2 pre-rRNA processing
MPSLDPGPSLPLPYFRLDKDGARAPTLVRDPDTEEVDHVASTSSIAKTLPPPPELSKKTGLPLTKAEKKAVCPSVNLYYSFCSFTSTKQLKDATTGPKWFDLPAPSGADLPRLAREVDAMRLRNALDPKRFYRKEDTKAGPLPKYFAIGHILTTPSPFGGPSRDDLPRAARKRTIVDELMEDDEARTYAKRKFNELQSVRGERGRATWKKKRDLRARKW